MGVSPWRKEDERRREMERTIKGETQEREDESEKKEFGCNEATDKRRGGKMRKRKIDDHRENE